MAALVPFLAMRHKGAMKAASGTIGADLATSRSALGGFLRRTGRLLVDFALPPRCPACGVVVGEDRQFCGDCWASLDFLDGPACALCSIPLPSALPGDAVACGACLADPPPFEGAPAAVAYGPAARTVALRLKYGRRVGHARLMAQLLVRHMPGGQDGELLLVPVPLHRWRLWSRGFNQAGLVARALSTLTGAAHDQDLLRRVKATPPLRGKGRRDRVKIVAGAFALAPGARERAHGRHIVLIDDVHASGATLRAAARALRHSGARRISALTWARVVPDTAATGNIFDIAALDSDMDGERMTG